MLESRSTSVSRRPRPLRGLFGAFVALSVCGGLDADDVAGRSGRKIYAELCARCHGASGEGVEGKLSEPLVGDKSVAQLTRYIGKRMPKKDAEKCVGDDAQKVARYIHEAFYSPIARARIKAPRVELSRMTVGQYRNAVADLVGHFRPAKKPGDARGLRAEYFNARDPGKNRVVERVDGRVSFDLRDENPDPGKLGTQGFAARWSGSVIAPETGDYEFVVRTDHAMRLWVNDLQRPLIDWWVKSGADTEFRASISLLGGRSYPLRLEFSSRDQGVKKDKKGKRPPIAAFVSLCWKLPRREVEVIPARHLTPSESSRVYVVGTPFPPDDRSIGFERGTSASQQWDAATTDAAIETAGHVAEYLGELAGAGQKDGDRDRKLREFCERWTERAFGRPLETAEHTLFVERQFGTAPDTITAVKRVVLLTLKSPRFLYPDIGVGPKPDAHAVASRLSMALWDSIPDSALLDAVDAGKLSTPEQVEAQARRMVKDDRCRAKVRDFLHRWLDVEKPRDLDKDEKLFPGFDAALAADLRTSLDLFLDDVIWSERSDFRELLLSRSLFVNGRLGKFYGFEMPDDASFEKRPSLMGRRIGVLTHPYLLSGFAYADASSPIHRGVFLVRSLLGRGLRPPPESFTPFATDLHPDLTTRERVALQTKPEACQSCHETINALGFSLESFDAVGRYREKENSRPVDASGFYSPPSGERKSFAGAGPLAEILVASAETHRAFVVQLFQHLVKQPIGAFGSEQEPNLRIAFSADSFNVRRLIVRIVTETSLSRPAVEAAETGRGPDQRRF